MDLPPSPRVINGEDVWHRVPGEVDGLNLALSLHSPEVVEANKLELTREAGKDSMHGWTHYLWER